MSHTAKIRPIQRVPAWKSPAEARTELAGLLDDFFQSAVHAPGSIPPLALGVSPGLGKTRETLGHLARYGRKLLERGHILFFAPTLELADEAATELRQRAPDLPVTVLRGRDACDPSSGRKMCARASLAGKIAGLVPSVTHALCYDEDDLGARRYSDCFRGCAYLGQMPRAFEVIFLAHSYLVTGLPFAGEIACRIIDERIWPALISSPELTLSDWLAGPGGRVGGELRNIHTAAQTAVFRALQDGRPVIAELKTAGVTKENLHALAKGERDSVPDLVIRPWQDPKTQTYQAETYDLGAFRRHRTRARIFDVLARAWDREATRRLAFGKSSQAETDGEVLRLYQYRPLPTDAPLLLLDADADRTILTQVAGDLSVAHVDVRPDAEIVQVSDRTLSNTWLNDPGQGRDRRGQVAHLIRREVARSEGRGVLVVATRDVLAALHRDAGHAISEHPSDEELSSPLHGATPRWFGPKMLGINSFRTYRTCIVIGRLQPGVWAVERALRCLFGDETDLTFAEAGNLSKAGVGRLTLQDTLEDAYRWGHPDERGQAILSQMRERMTQQAIARLRLVLPSGPKRIILASNLPLPEVPVSRTATFADLIAGLENEPFPRKRRRLDGALATRYGPEVRFIRLSDKGLEEDLPWAFQGQGSGHYFRRGLKTEDLYGIIERLAAHHGWPCTRLVLSRAGHGGTAVPAVAFLERSHVPDCHSGWPGLMICSV